jgi:hypothetical protein
MGVAIPVTSHLYGERTEGFQRAWAPGKGG